MPPLIVGSGACQMEVDFAARRVTVGGQEVLLTPTEYDLLALLAERAGTVVTLDELIGAVWGDWFGPRNHVSVHIHHIGRKLGPCASLIVTKRSVGYMLDTRTRASVSLDTLSSDALLSLLEQDAASRRSVWLIGGPDRLVSWVSSTVTGLLGWPASEMVGHSPWEFVHEDDLDKHGLSDDMTPEGVAGPIAARARHADGTWVPIQVYAHFFHDGQGAFLGSLGRWETRSPGEAGWGEALDLETILRDELQSSLDSPLATLVYDANSVLLKVDPHVPFLGWNPDRLVGTYFSLGGMTGAATRQVLDATLSRGATSFGGPTIAIASDGDLVPVHVDIQIHTEGGRMTGYTGRVYLRDED